MVAFVFWGLVLLIFAPQVGIFILACCIGWAIIGAVAPKLTDNVKLVTLCVIIGLFVIFIAGHYSNTDKFEKSAAVQVDKWQQYLVK